MSFTYPKFFADRVYFEMKTDMSRGDIVGHHLLYLEAGQYLLFENFRELDSYQVKIAEVVMLVAPPTFMTWRPGVQKIVEKPIVVVSTIVEPEEESPDSTEEIAIADILRKQLG